MKNMSTMGLLWMRQWSSQKHKSRIIRSNLAQHGFLFCDKWCSHTGVKYALSTGEGLQTFWRNIAAFYLGLLALKMEVNWPSTGQNAPDDLNVHQHRCQNFTTTNCCHETARNYQSVLRKIPKERRSHLHRVRSLKSRHCGSGRNHRTTGLLRNGKETAMVIQ